MILLFGLVVYPLSFLWIGKKRNLNLLLAQLIGAGMGAIVPLVLVLELNRWYPKWLPGLPKPAYYTWLCGSIVSLIIAYVLPKKALLEAPGVTLPMPLPPGTRDWGDKR